MKKLVPGVNDLLTTNPDLAKEWNYERNGALLPSDFSAGSGKRVWWECANGHEWESSILNRSHGHACPYCSGKTILRGYNDLATTHPEIVLQWDYERNILKPKEVSHGSKQKVWWKCSQGHSWDATIGSRVNGNGCPYCSGKKVLNGYNDLATTHPSIAKEWDYELNNSLSPFDLTAGSNRKIHWICKYGHRWSTTVYHRVRGTGCPICASALKTSFPEQAIYFYIKKKHADAINRYADLFDNGMELDIYIPSLKIGIEYDGSVWHSSTRAKEKEISKYKTCSSSGIFLIRIREDKNNKDNSSADKVLYTLDSLDDTIRQLGIFSLVEANTINSKKDQIYIMEQYLQSQESESIAAKYPQLVNEWHPTKNGNLSPNLFSYSSHQKVWWMCKFGHEWEASPHNRTGANKTGCPVCSGQKVLPGFNDLASQYPEIALEWDYSKNKGLKPSDFTTNSTKRIWWVCAKGHSWETPIHIRTNGSDCPFCAGRAVLPGFNDLASNYPAIAKEWDKMRNENLLPSQVTVRSGKKVWWVCSKCGFSWQSTIDNRVRGNGCPECKRGKISVSARTRKVVAGVNDLATTHPQLLKEWDYQKNSSFNPTEVLSGSGIKVWWKCSKCGRSWQTRISHRANGHGCPSCGHKK